MKTILSGVVAALVLSTVGGCGSGAGSLGVGEILPPVRDSLPSALTSTSGATRRDVAEITTMQERFFTDGPTDFLNRLAKVDERLVSLSNRHSESARTCVSETAKAWELTGLPDGQTFTMYFSCMESLSRGLTLYFGQNGDYSYVAELQIDDSGDTPTMAVLAKVNNDSTQAEVWQVIITPANEVGGDDSKKRSAWMYINGDKTAKTFELAAASTGDIGNPGITPFNGVGCGVRLNVNETLVYGTGVFKDWNVSAGTNCGEAPAEVCANGSDLDAAAGGVPTCETAGLDTFATTTPNMLWTALSTKTGGTVQDGYTTAKSIIEGTGIPTLTDFNTQR